MSQTNIITGQYVRISQSPASIVSRIIAWLIDIILIIIYTTGITFSLINISPNIDSDVTLIVFLMIIYFPALCYPLICEVFFNGQSIGKKY